MTTFNARLALAALATMLPLSGCVTTQGGSPLTISLPTLQPVDFSSIADTFSSQIRELKRLVAESKFSEADALYVRERDYFQKRYAGTASVPPELTQLGEYVWRTRYERQTQDVLVELKTVSSLDDPQSWPSADAALAKGRKLSEAVSSDSLLQLTNLGSRERAELDAQVVRVVTLAKSDKPQAVQNTFAETLRTGRHRANYIAGDEFSVADYSESLEFQRQAVDQIRSKTDRQQFVAEAAKLAVYLNAASKDAVDSAYVELARRELFAGGRLTLEKVAALSNMGPPFGGGREALSRVVNIGYVDLTAAGFKDRNVFDFEISFKQDLPFATTSAADSIFTDAEISKYEFVFVTDLSVAKVSRNFKSKNDIASRVQTGTREMPNPEYVRAMTNYQRAMAEFQSAQINSAVPKPCVGWGCALQGLADGIQSSAARNNLDRASSALANTSRTTSEPVYADYKYQKVEIDTTKTADVTYYVIDVAGKRIHKNTFQVNENEVFGVAYNVRDQDPDKTSILRNVKSEEEVVSWEKRPIVVAMSTLFNPENLRGATQSPYSGIQAFLQTLGTRTYAAAGPVYSSSVAEPKNMRSAARDTIVDERFDSIVIIRNAQKAGTGFYVTPDLVLTAFHVVDGSSLVEMTFYDGTRTYGRVIDHDVRLDLALVKAQTAGKPLKIHTGPIKLGETVEAIGHPQGYEFTITRGVVSAIRKQRGALGSDVLVEFVQTDTPISPGNSGGPLLLKDAVIGVNDWIRVDKGSQNLNFSVSYNELRSYLERMKGKR